MSVGEGLGWRVVELRGGHGLDVGNSFARQLVHP